MGAVVLAENHRHSPDMDSDEVRETETGFQVGRRLDRRVPDGDIDPSHHW